MGGYASTAKKAKTTEEGDDRDLHYAASGMQVSLCQVYLQRGTNCLFPRRRAPSDTQTWTL